MCCCRVQLCNELDVLQGASRECKERSARKIRPRIEANQSCDYVCDVSQPHVAIASSTDRDVSCQLALVSYRPLGKNGTKSIRKI